jgi:hypothetical protein
MLPAWAAPAGCDPHVLHHRRQGHVVPPPTRRAPFARDFGGSLASQAAPTQPARWATIASALTGAVVRRRPATRLRAPTAARRSTRWSNSPLRRRIRSSVVRRTMTRTPPPCGASPSAARLPKTPSFSMERWRWFRRTNQRAFHRHSPRKSATSGACAPQGLSGRTESRLARSRFWAHPVGDFPPALRPYLAAPAFAC